MNEKSVVSNPKHDMNMKLKLQSKVTGEFKTVFDAFDKELFKYLLPPNAELIQFDGSKVGDIVHLSFGFPINAEWVSEITKVHCEENQCYFVDEGKKLPFGLKHWQHKHIVRREEASNCSLIEDDIEFSTGKPLLDKLIYPFLYLAFSPRKRQYRSYFKSYTSSDTA